MFHWGLVVLGKFMQEFEQITSSGMFDREGFAKKSCVLNTV